MNMLRPISRKYDQHEHEYPKELDMLAAMIDGLSESGQSQGAGASGVRRRRATTSRPGRAAPSNGTNLASVLSIMEMCWGDVGLLLSMPRQGLGNSAIASVANDEQAERFKGVWAGMAITEPGVGSDSANIRTTAVKDGDEYVINGEKIYVTAGDRCDARRGVGDAGQDPGPRRDQVVRRPEGHARHDRGAARAQARHPLLGHRGDPLRRTAGCRPRTCSATPDVDTKQGFAGAMATFDNTRPLVAAMAVGCARASLDLTRELLERGRCRDRLRPLRRTPSRAAAATLPAAGVRLGGAPTCSPWSRPGWPTTGSRTRCRPRWPRRRPAASAPTSRCGCVELAGSVGYSEHELLEKWARDSKILDIFEGTQQIQQLIVARRLLGLSSTELK